MKSLTIVVPVYNVEKYLKRCLDSIICQIDQEDVEIIAVNDGSTDSSTAILRDYESRKNSLLKVINKKNGGLGDARNEGLMKSSGEYIAFVDSDDYLGENTIRRVFNQSKNMNCDIIEYPIVPVVGDGKLLRPWRSKVDREKILTDNDIMLQAQFIITSVCNKIFKASLFKDSGVLFPKNIYHEDMPVCPILLALAKRYMFTDNGAYYYTIKREGSITSTVDEKKVCVDIVKGVEYMHGEAKRLHLVNNDNRRGWANCLAKNYFHYRLKCHLGTKDKNVDLSAYRLFVQYIAIEKKVSLPYIHQIVINNLMQKERWFLTLIIFVWIKLLIIKNKLVNIMEE